MAIYVHVKPLGEVADLAEGNPFEAVTDGRVALTHSECVGGSMAIEEGDGVVTLVCSQCQARQDLERDEATDALRRVLVDEEYAWAGDAGFLPD